MGADDVVFELEVTTDRGYCMAMRGIAREVAGALAADWRDPAAVTPPVWPGEPAWTVQVEDAGRCDRFSMIAMEGLDPAAASPWWLRRRLAQSGIRSISLAVDVTNLVMLELGQPMHAFDRDTVRGPITVRTARSGERLTTLDGVDRALDPDDLLITDDSGPIGLAGVMGGASTEITADGDRGRAATATTAVLLEAAHWEPAGIGRGVRRHRLPSEAAKRFERGTDPDITVVALARAAALLAEYGGATVVGGAGRRRHPRAAAGDRAGRRPARPDRRHPDPDRPGGGRPAHGGGDGRRPPGTGLLVVPPSWRPDLTDPADLVEEVVRSVGYDAIPSVLPTVPPGRGLTAVQRRRRAIGRALAEAGYVEAPAYPFIGLPVAGGPRAARRRPAPACAAVAQPALGGGAGAAHHAAARPAGHAGPQPWPGPARPRPLRARRGVPGRRTVRCAPLPPVSTAVPTTTRWPRCWAPSRPSPGTSGWSWPGSREPRGWWGPGRPAGWADAVAGRTAGGRRRGGRADRAGR